MKDIEKSQKELEKARKKLEKDREKLEKEKEKQAKKARDEKKPQKMKDFIDDVVKQHNKHRKKHGKVRVVLFTSSYSIIISAFVFNRACNLRWAT